MNKNVLKDAAIALFGGVATASLAGYFIASTTTSTLTDFTRSCPAVIGSDKVIKTSYGFPFRAMETKDGLCINSQKDILPGGMIMNVLLFSLIGYLVCLLVRKVV